MRTALFFIFLSGCGPAYLSGPEPVFDNVAENAAEIECDLYGSEYSVDDLQEVVTSYEDLSSSSGIMMAFYEDAQTADAIWVIDGLSDDFSIVSSEVVGKEGEDVLYDTTFSMDLSDIRVNRGIGKFFTEQGEQDLVGNEEITFIVWGNDQTELKFFELLVSSALSADEIGSCTLY